MDIVVNAAVDELPAGHASIPHQGNFYPTVLTRLGYPENSPPVADWLRRYHHLEGHWLIASPIHWQATHNDAMIIACGDMLQLSDVESRRWFSAFAELTAAENITIIYHDAHTWLLRCDDRPPITARPVHQLLHQSLMTELRALDETLFWQRFITESQMFFSSHSLNQSRLGSYSINGIWLWGNGELHAPGQRPLFGANEKLVQLAKLLSTNAHAFDWTIIKNSVLLFDTLNKQDEHTLQQHFKKNNVHWYWNNMAYTSKPKTWLQRLGIKNN